MERFDKKEDYLEQLRIQIRCKKARNIVAEEINQHIEDQKCSYINEGDDENTAMVKALEQMGDPIVVGQQMNKIHKPRIEWRIVLIVLVLSCLGVLAQLSIKNSIIDAKLFSNIDVGRHILFVIIGFLLMLATYFMDYTIIGKYPKLIWFLLVVGFLLYAQTGVRVNGSVRYLYAYSMLFLPVYGGIIYAYRKKGYIGIIKCLLLSILTSILELRFVAQSSVYLGLLLSSLILLSIAVMKNWFGTSKRIGMAILWGWMPTAFIMFKLFHLTIFRQYQIERLKNLTDIMLHPERYDQGYQINVIRQVITHSKLIGGTTDYIVGYLPSLNTDNILTYVIGKWGILAGVLIIGLFIAFIGRMINISYHQNNSLGMYVGLACSLVFAIQGGIYILSNLSLEFIAQVNLPFVSYSGSSILVSFIILGILLSVFRNTTIIKEVPYKEKLPIKLVIKLEKVK